MAAEGAHFGVVNGWERMEYVKPNNEFKETYSFRFNEVFGRHLSSQDKGTQTDWYFTAFECKRSIRFVEETNSAGSTFAGKECLTVVPQDDRVKEPLGRDAVGEGTVF